MSNFRYRLACWLLKPLFNAVTADKVFYFDKRAGVFFYGKKSLTAEDVQQLAEEISLLRKLHIWKLMQHEMKYVAQKQLFETASNENELLFPRSVFFVLETIDKKMNNIKRAARKVRTSESEVNES